MTAPSRPYEFWRTLVLVGGGVLLIYLGGTLFLAAGAGLLVVAVIAHMTTIMNWMKEDIITALSPEGTAAEQAEKFAHWVLEKAKEKKRP